MLSFEMHLLEQNALMAFIKSNYLSNASILKSRKENITSSSWSTSKHYFINLN